MLGDGEILAPACGLEEEGSQLQMSGFEFVNMADYGLKDERYTTDLFPYCSHEVIAMMKIMGYMSGIGLGKEGKGVVEFSNVKTQVTRKGLGFFEGCDEIKKNLGTLNENFMKEGENILYCGFPEPWVGKDGKVYPGWEMFFNEKLTFKEKPTVVIKEIQEEVDWVNYMDVEVMKTMMKTSGDVFAITNEEPSDPSKFIMLGPINNWTWVGFTENMGKKFCNASFNVLFNFFNKMNSDLAYFDVSHNIEILHLNDSNV